MCTPRRSRREAEVAWRPVLAWHLNAHSSGFPLFFSLLFLLEGHPACESPWGTCRHCTLYHSSSSSMEEVWHWPSGQTANFISRCGHQKSQSKQPRLDELDELTCLFSPSVSADSHGTFQRLNFIHPLRDRVPKPLPHCQCISGVSIKLHMQ